MLHLTHPKLQPLIQIAPHKPEYLENHSSAIKWQGLEELLVSPPFCRTDFYKRICKPLCSKAMQSAHDSCHCLQPMGIIYCDKSLEDPPAASLRAVSDSCEAQRGLWNCKQVG